MSLFLIRRALSFPLLTLLSILFSLVLFFYLYSTLYAYWLSTVGPGAWPPAWPVSRTRFVIFIAVLPIFATCMVVWMVLARLFLFICSARSKRHRDYQLALNPHDDNDDNDLQFSVKHSQDRCLSWWSVRLATFIIFIILGLYTRFSYDQPNDIRYRPLVERAVHFPRSQGYGNGEKVFLAAMFYNNERIIPYWSKQIIKFIHYIGTDNIFVSIVESNSGDNTPDLLLQFDKKLQELGVPHNVTVHDTSIPRPPNMDTAPARIEFLSKVRNLVMRPLVEKGGFDKVIFSNDVFIEAESVVELLRTRDGDYDMACGLDLSYWGLYDAWVTRDRLGRIVSSLWPYLADDIGKEAIMNDEPAPVFACWNGITVFKAEPFLPLQLRLPGKLSTSPFSKQLPTTHPAYPRPENQSPATTPPLQFRASTASECFSSESFNMPYDLRRLFNMQQIYINPRVITSYDWHHYVWYKYVTRHWLVKWWMQTWEKGWGMEAARMIIGNAANIWGWDGGECQPWH
ncbi:glycosyltransferase family 69 protein [Amanita thiersii Skay4041]|uniref:Glycosyltransferase family 69 protein n=1 Tax=Amanita thiersii Skay4041 TaxID=703135 RepID=A0A2A9NN68_9AGAR|nr:glycosyltransferase family 69 protein [Amanita thiersii Skay4041]